MINWTMKESDHLFVVVVVVMIIIIVVITAKTIEIMQRAQMADDSSIALALRRLKWPELCHLDPSSLLIVHANDSL